MHDLLLGLGAFLLAVAAIGFLVFSWSVLNLTGRAVIIAGCTVTVLAVAGWLRPRLGETAEAVGALGAVLVVGDAWAVRSTGLLGADRPAGLAYAAGATAVCAGVVGAWGAFTRLRAGSIAAALLAPAGVLLTGAAVADATDDAAPFAAGLVATALLAAGRAVLPRAWNAERVLLRLTAGGALVLAAVFAVPMLGMAAPAATAVLVLAAAVALLQAPADLERGTRAPIESLTHRRVWSTGAGVLAAAVSVPAAWGVVDGTGLDGRWTAALVPIGAGLVLLAVAAVRSAPGGIRLFAVTAGVAAVTALAALPAALTGLSVVARAALLVLRPWRVGMAEAIGTAGGPAYAPVTTGTWLPGVVGLLATAATAGLGAVLLRRRVRRRDLPGYLAAVVAAAVLLAVLVLPLAPRLTVAASVGLLVAVAIGLAVLAAAPPAAETARVFSAGSAAAGTLATLVAWSTRPLSVPVTVVAIAGLLLARRAVTAPPARAALVALAAGASVLVAGAVPGLVDRGTTAADRLAVAATVGVLLAAALLVLPRPAWSPLERLAGAAAAAVAVVPGLATGFGDVVTGGGHWPAELQLGALLLAVLAVCAAARADVVAVADLRVPAAGLITPAVAALALVVADDLRADPVSAVVLAAAVFAVAVPLAALVLVGRVRDGSRRLCAEVTTAVVGAVALLAALGAGGDPEQVADRLWVTLLLLGAAAAAIAAVPDRRRVGWLSGVLLTGSSWARLALADVETVEAYSLPPAAALLVVAVLRLRRDPHAIPERVLASAFGLAVVPSVLAGATGGPLRPGLLIASGGAMVAAVAWPAAARLHRAFLIGGCLAAVGAAAARIVAALQDVADVPGELPVDAIETWSLAATGVVAVAAGLRRRVRAEADLLLAVALATLLTPSLLAVGVPVASGGDPGGLGAWRSAAAFAVAAAATLVVFATDPARPPRPGIAMRTGIAYAVAATLAGLATEVTSYHEVWTLPLAVLLLAVGALWLGRSDAGSWPALGVGLAVLLLPSLLLALGDVGDGHNNVRAPALAILAGATVATGAMRRLQAPLLFGAGVLIVHGIRRLAPYVADVDLPPWAVLAAVGLALLVLGATYERRIQQLRRARLRIASMR